MQILTNYKVIVGTIGFILLSLFFINQASAATTGTVAATVTVQNISVTVSDGSVAYGTLATSAQGDTTAGGVNDSQTATNDGNVSEDLDIKGENTTAWTLAGSIGADQYKHDFCITTCDSTPTWTALTTSYQALATGVATSGTQIFDLRINTPSSSTSFTQQTATVTVLASAS
ncbi:hypothetical protein A3H80_01645 [Candidatus Roizmanbacteria bacterium RIFCSPLOWO2_02_FULL_37_19]|uniref:WxL domain-containing protein n=1 Tax=Candidatus Roizmanbacteria bacterium RIFCSPHIGHO2_02_FULL_37_24 TaxID=1802037 RepID=A0A1F7H1P5_9BACT|nr:MAG: hypothetical protein A2862_04540 [Candidatus Roizmanbacteria bacterium RIFCSPHIGHO2_01_FULL_38_41]OGK24622.1 MAG: hypothetical protein A3C24_02425 [Candidatus Roizmanbacteria bacterium RIFCSPHIGHO2_02_FULL_37_24]OGK32260.1 MAG: hypothetical protein A3E10_02365 [Candidatus Roizmanbacteria bacterium RIFCSPHIGHO2_12_FULL_37_23]OGK45554.1 MAG: hypothetical protein A2956_03135 [Candidatus Roizmanbacteria bacterium RIFCSPLOWO2_01_FULL_37_57]OGK53893.1 MAG: hypothetical protein A3H80_01645 [Ca